MMSLGSGAVPALRRLAQLSILLAVATLLATVAALLRLPYAAASGQGIVLAAGVLLGITAFAFGVATSLRKPIARVVGFAVVGLACLAAVLFGMIAAVAPESAGLFMTWAAVLLSYAAYATFRLVRWPAQDWEAPRSSLALFISYRREDSRDTVGRIHDHLQQSFDKDRLFLDVDDQAPGEDYRTVIGRALASADVVLAVIGPHWLAAATSHGQRRLDDTGDMVRIELESALQGGMRVVPVLIENATMPRPADVPASLQPLCYRTAVPVRPDPDFMPDIRRLIEAVVGAPGAADL